MKKLIIAGGTGFLGTVLESHFSKLDYEIIILTRNPTKSNHVLWDAKTIGSWVSELENSDAIINLVGKSVDCRYTNKNKKLILDSRVDSTRVIGKAINQFVNPPKTWFNSSTATIYKYSLDKEMSEMEGEYGTGFSVNIAKSWESSFHEIEHPKTRKLILRISIVFGKQGGAIVTLKTITKLGLGGKQGSGKQKVSWIHQTDFCRIVEFLLINKNLKGAFNLCVPNPTNNKTLMKTLRNEMHIPIGISQPAWLVKFGAILIGTEAELVLKSRNVIPKKLLDNGFIFQYSNLNKAISNLIN